ARARNLLRGLYRDRSRADSAPEDTVAERAGVSRSAGTVRRNVCCRHGCRSNQDVALADRTPFAERGVGRVDEQHQEQADPQKARKAIETCSRVHELAL